MAAAGGAAADPFRGRVAQVRMNATTVQNVVTYDTIIEFDNHATLGKFVSN